MNGPIVFRAWYINEDKDDGIMREIEITTDGYINAWIEQEDGSEEQYVIGAIDDNRVVKQIPVMQYLGIKDKNDNPIFEGDIVITDEAGWKAKVIFERDMYYCIDNKGGFATECNWEKYEIIGNIYENPELLEK